MIQDENEHTIGKEEGDDISEVPEIIPPTTCEMETQTDGPPVIVDASTKCDIFT